MTEWINVNIRVPGLGESAGYTFDGEYISHENYYDNHYQRWEYENGMGYLCKVEKPITHWIPYPKKPV